MLAMASYPEYKESGQSWLGNVPANCDLVNSPWKPIVAFSVEHECGGAKVTEAPLNGFSSKIEDYFELTCPETTAHLPFAEKAEHGVHPRIFEPYRDGLQVI